MIFDELRDEDGTYVDSEGCGYDDIVEYLHTSKDWCGFCGCGNPEDSLLCLYRAMKLIKARFEDMGWNDFSKECDKLFGCATYFIWYALDKMELTEHGGSVPGWLTEKGEEMLVALEELNIEEVCRKEGSDGT